MKYKWTLIFALVSIAVVGLWSIESFSDACFSFGEGSYFSLCGIAWLIFVVVISPSLPVRMVFGDINDIVGFVLAIIIWVLVGFVIDYFFRNKSRKNE